MNSLARARVRTRASSEPSEGERPRAITRDAMDLPSVVPSGPRFYRLVRQIAAGGMAQVYEAELELEGGLRRRVALKRVLPEYASDRAHRAMFLDEARLLSTLAHPNVVPLLDFGVAEGAEFLVLGLVDGLDAGEAFRRLRVQGVDVEPLATYVVAEVARALAYAHALVDERGVALGLVHRDVSPSNVLCGWDGSVALTDFGIALSRLREERTATGFVKGKLAYMPPEQARGERVTAAADVWALAATWCALVSGEAGGVDALSPAARELVARCRRIAPDERPRAEELVHALEALVRSSARTELAASLSALRGAAVASVFDRALDLVLAGGDDHAFTVTAPVPTRAPDASQGDLTRSAKREERAPPEPISDALVESPPRAASRSRSVGALAVLSVALLLVVLGVAWANDAWVDGARVGDATADASQAAVASLEETRVDERVEAPVVDEANARSTRTLAVASAEVDAGARVDAPDVGVERPRGSSRRGAPRAGEPGERADDASIEGPAERRGASDAPSPASDAPSLETGWLRVGGESLLRGSVELDGRSVGHAPLERQVALGAHRIVVRGAGGEVLVDTRVDVDATHQRATPLRITR